MHKLLHAAVASLLYCLSWQAAALELYRYVDDKGVTVLDRQGVPPQFVGKGYDVLDGQGRVVRHVPPAPTAQERAAQAERAAQQSSDEKLLRLYSSVEDVDSALRRRLAELDSVIELARGNLQAVRQQLDAQRAQAAAAQRNGREVPPETLQQLRDLGAEQARLQRDIARHQQDRDDAEASHAADRQRVGQLLHGE